MDSQNKEIKNSFIKTRVSEAEKDRVIGFAKSCNQSISEYSRSRLLGYRADNNKQAILQLQSQQVAILQGIARQVTMYPNDIDKLLLLEALNSIAEKES